MDTRLPAGTRISSGSNLWFRITRLNSWANAGVSRTPSAASTIARTTARITFDLGDGRNDFRYEGLQRCRRKAIVALLNYSNLCRRARALRRKRGLDQLP